MSNQEILFDLTETYLVSLVAGASGKQATTIDPAAPFGELGIDSFRVLKIIKVLESDFGTLPKTLLFEFFNIESLARYFVEHHAKALDAKFGSAQAPAVPAPKQQSAPPARPAAPAPAKPVAKNHAVRLLEQDLPNHPDLEAVVQALLASHMNEGSVSRGTRNIAPNLFIGSQRKGFFNYARSGKTILVYAYTGPDACFDELAAEMVRHCREHDLDLSLFSDRHIGTIDGVAFSATPFGALQRVLNLQQFTLDGGPMRRLRYQVAKFEKSGAGRTVEYRCGTDHAVDENIALVIDKWRETKTMVNPLIAIVRDEILAGTLHAQHRIFLTYLGDKLQNVILISKMCAALNGYLMDLEFYGKEMPLGGLEFGIANIIKALAAEGCDTFSLGGTYGCRLEESPVADAGVDAILNDLHKQNIFNDESNLQFKNKFRPENRSIFICRPVGCGNPDSIIDIIMMIADPAKAQTPDNEHHNAAGGVTQAPSLRSQPAATPAKAVLIDGQARSQVLAESGFNPINVPAERVDYDLKTDSWAQLQMPAIARRKRHLHAQLQRPADLGAALAAIFPFDDIALTTSGRAAESVFCQAMQRQGVVLGNLLFPTTIFHQIDKGFAPRELPNSAVFRRDARELYKGNMDLALLREQVAQHGSEVAYVCIELNNNAAGGYPVAEDHLRKVKALLEKHAIPLVIDATRVIENARFLIDNEAEYANRTVWDVVRALLGHADAIVVSLAKDFCVSGGMIASHDQQLMARVRGLIEQEACGLDAIDRKMAAVTLQDRQYLDQQSAIRWNAVRRIYAVLKQQGVPIVEPAGGHCILIDVKQITQFANFDHPVASFLACLYLNTGIRGGAHNAGMQKETSINGLVRLAVPLGISLEQADDIGARIAGLFADLSNIPEIAPEGSAAEALGNIHARYALVQYHGLASAAVVAPPPAPAPAHAAPPLLPRGEQDIAVVGMAGRYPKASNMAELWNNLVQKTDCIAQIPDERYGQRLRNAYSAPYRGGFIDDVDRFDARFFGVSAQEATILDPQERLFLEVAYEAIEDAGYYPEILAKDNASRDIGVFVGAVWSMYQMLGAEQKIEGHNVNPTSFFWSIANRVSYWMNLTGPSLTLDTACSASLTAIKLACDAIRSGECSGAIVGGVNLDLHQSKLDVNAMGGSLSPDGMCRSFGKDANGYVSGEGIGALFLKPLAQAVADGDHIYGVIKSAVVTHGGRTSGYTIPSPRPQTELILKALDRAGIDARSMGYIEAHGTGTELGDSIEIAGLTQAYAKFGVDKQSCPIGSIKTNIGHLEAASGIVGVQKILLQMKHRTLVPSLHAQQTSDSIDFLNSPFYVQQELETWLPKQVDGVAMPLRAGISAMGAGGTNAHLVIEQFVPADERAKEAPALRVFPLSARSEEQLVMAALRLRAFAAAPGSEECDIAHTLCFGRKSFDFRLAVLATTREELGASLDDFIAGRASDAVLVGHVRNAEALTGLLNAREKQDFVGLLVRSGDPRRLGKLWTDGVIAEWKGIGMAEDGKRIALPTYPFNRDRYWIGQAAAANEPRAPRAAPAKVVERYEFPVPSDHHALSGQLLKLEVGDKARLFTGQLLADQLGISIGQITYDAQLMDTGLTSMDMAEMSQAIKTSMDPAFSPTAFFACTTIASLCDLLAREYTADFEKMAVIRRHVEDISEPVAQAEPGARNGQMHVMDAQSDLPLPVTPLPAAQQEPLDCVLLTGATGFLGVHLLAELLKVASATRVLCLVRAADKQHGLQRIVAQADKYQITLDTSRIAVLCGDVNAPRLGLSDADWAHCAREVQQIVHASAHVNHIEGYATFRESTLGMKEIIRLAGSERPKLIQFISSIAGCARKIGDAFSIFEHEDFLDDGEHVYGGYGQSKWVQETYLKRAAAQGIPYVIYRFGELAGSSVTGLGQSDDMLHRLLQMRLAIGCREKISNDVLDMLPVDFAASLVAKTGAAPQLWNRIVHATHLKPYSFAKLYRHAAEKGLDATPVAREQFLARCYEFIEYIYSINSVNGFVLECVMRDVEGSIKQRKMMDSYFAVLFPFAQSHFQQALKTLDLALPDWNSLIKRYFSAWEQEENGFMHTIHAYRAWRDSDARTHGCGASHAAIPGEARIIELFLEGERQ